MLIGHKSKEEVACNETFMCLPEVHPDHYKAGDAEGEALLARYRGGESVPVQTKLCEACDKPVGGPDDPNVYPLVQTWNGREECYHVHCLGPRWYIHHLHHTKSKPFQHVACGADIPAMRSTVNPDHVTCPQCRERIKPPARPFVPGDVVRLKSGGVLMTVRGAEALLRWNGAGGRLEAAGWEVECCWVKADGSPVAEKYLDAMLDRQVTNG